MSRSLAQTIQAVLAAQAAETHDLCEITLPAVTWAVPSLPAVTLFTGTAGIQVAGQWYEPSIRAVPVLKFSLGRAPDQAAVEIENLSGTYGALIANPARVLDGALCVLKRAFLTGVAGGGYETDILMRGYLSQPKLTSENFTFTILPAMSRKGSAVAGRKLTQRCVWVFGDTHCGVIVPPGGTCTHVYDDAVGGCAHWDNQHRFGGIPQLTPIAAQQAQEDGLHPKGNQFGGYGTGTHPVPSWKWDRDYQPYQS